MGNTKSKFISDPENFPFFNQYSKNQNLNQSKDINVEPKINSNDNQDFIIQSNTSNINNLNFEKLDENHAHRSKDYIIRLEKLRSNFPKHIKIPNEIKYNSKEFNSAKERVYEKLKKYGFNSLPEKEINQLIKILICSESMLNTYLSEDNIGTSKILEILGVNAEDDINVLNNENCSIKEKYLKVKFVVVDQSPDDSKLRTFLSPILSSIGKAPKYGIFHTAIIVGPFYLEWNNSSLCIPRKCSSSHAKIVSDLTNDLIGPHVTLSLEHLSRIICHWNANVEYSNTKNNCQKFVEELCNGLNINIVEKYKNTSIGLFLDNMRKSGSSKLIYHFSPILHEKCPWIKEKYGNTITFETHKSLDDFVNEIKKSLSNELFFIEELRNDINLIKSFDRAFWLRYNNEKKKKGINNISEELLPHSNGCPFNDPQETGSFTDWFASKNPNLGY